MAKRGVKKISQASTYVKRYPTAGRPKHVPTDLLRGQVIGYSVSGTTQATIAAILGMDLLTLRKHYKTELETSAPKAIAIVGQTAFQMATGGGLGAVGRDGKPVGADWRKANPAMAQYILSRRGGEAWKDPAKRLAHSGAIGTVDLSKLSDEEFAKLESILGPLADLGDSELPD